MINNKTIEIVSNFNFLGLTINEHLDWGAHLSKIAAKISRTLGVMNRLKKFLPFSALKLMYESLISSHLQFNITSWGFTCNRVFKLQKRAIRILCNAKYNAHTEPLFKQLYLLKLDDIFNMQCLKFWYRYSNKLLPPFFRTMFTNNYDIYGISTRQRNDLHLFHTRTQKARSTIRHYVPNILHRYPRWLIERATTHSIVVFNNA